MDGSYLPFFCIIHFQSSDVKPFAHIHRHFERTTGVIDMKGFINALVRIGYDGPVECEPFDQQLRQMDAEAALQKTSDALKRVWQLIDV